MTAILLALGVLAFSALLLILVRASYWNGFRDGQRTGKAQNTGDIIQECSGLREQLQAAQRDLKQADEAYEAIRVHNGARMARIDELQEQLATYREALWAIRDCQGAVNETVEAKMRRIASAATAPNPAKRPT